MSGAPSAVPPSVVMLRPNVASRLVAFMGQQGFDTYDGVITMLIDYYLRSESSKKPTVRTGRSRTVSVGTRSARRRSPFGGSSSSSSSSRTANNDDHHQGMVTSPRILRGRTTMEKSPRLRSPSKLSPRRAVKKAHASESAAGKWTVHESGEIDEYQQQATTITFSDTASTESESSTPGHHRKSKDAFRKSPKLKLEKRHSAKRSFLRGKSSEKLPRVSAEDSDLEPDASSHREITGADEIAWAQSMAKVENKALHSNPDHLGASDSSEDEVVFLLDEDDVNNNKKGGSQRLRGDPLMNSMRISQRAEDADDMSSSVHFQMSRADDDDDDQDSETQRVLAQISAIEIGAESDDDAEDSLAEKVDTLTGNYNI